MSQTKGTCSDVDDLVIFVTETAFFFGGEKESFGPFPGLLAKGNPEMLEVVSSLVPASSLSKALNRFKIKRTRKNCLRSCSVAEGCC